MPEPFAVLLLDLDRFKQVNDELGHQIGDRLLQAVGPRLAKVLRKSDTLARFGGDEFAVLLPPPVDIETAAGMAERLIESMQSPFVIDGLSLDIGVSIGAAMHPEHGADLDSLIHNADVAMYEAKRERLGYSIFNAQQAQGSARRLALQRDLRPAIDGGDMQVLFQPKVAVAGWQVTGAEALLRWNHPLEGTLQPDDFLPIAEHTGLILPLTLKVVNDCLAAQRAWRIAGTSITVSINISAKWLRDREFPQILRLLLRNWQGRPEQLMLEIPENAVMLDPEGTLEALDAISSLGVGVALDHFGTGYSSLPMLQRLPITALKIDRTFVGDLFAERSANVVVRSVIKLAHGLGHQGDRHRRRERAGGRPPRRHRLRRDPGLLHRPPDAGRAAAGVAAIAGGAPPRLELTATEAWVLRYAPPCVAALRRRPRLASCSRDRSQARSRADVLELRLQLGKGDIRALRDPGADVGFTGGERRALETAEPGRRHIAGGLDPLHQFDDAADADLETFGGLPPGKAPTNRFDHLPAQVVRKRLRHPSLPSSSSQQFE